MELPIRLCHGERLAYRAFARRDPDADGWILHLLASCRYPQTGFRVFFAGSDDLTWALLEEQPRFYEPCVSHLAASATSPLAKRPKTVTIRDGHGAHQVDVADWDADEETAKPVKKRAVKVKQKRAKGGKPDKGSP